MPEITDVSIDKISSDIENLRPQTPLEIFDDTASEINEMEDEGTQPMIAESVARKQMNAMAANSPAGFSFTNDVHCRGASLSMGSAGKLKTASFSGAGGGRTPDNDATIVGVTRDGNQVVVATFNNSTTTHTQSLGRLNGYNGWGKFGESLHMAFASMWHNFQALLMGYAEVPELPMTDAWMLPNLVVDPSVTDIEDIYNASIEVPENMAPSARYHYSFMAPYPSIRFQLDIEAPNDSTKAYVQFMNEDKSETALSNEIEFPEGTSSTSVVLRGYPAEITSGYINVNPTNAPDGLTVSSVTTFPPTL